LAAEGYMSEAIVEPDDATTIRHHNCAVREIALRFPEVCSAEAEFMATVLDAPVERRMHLKDGCRACEYDAVGGAPRRAAATLPVPLSAPETPR
jgi:DeoR family transcriptional regulator, suf operon transcriptional repressor